MKPTLQILFLALLFLPVCLFAQATTDDFEDGDLLNPEWIGDVGDFAVSAGRLRLAATGAGESVLAVRLPPSRVIAADSFTLEFLVEMDFAPSASNYCTLDLLQESTIGTVAQSSISLRFGGISGDQDALSGTVTSQGDVVLGDFTGTAGALGGDPALVRFKITYRDGEGYRFYADYSGGQNYELQGEVREPVDLALDYLRITCVYTSSRSDKFSFDDLNYQVYLPADDTPPLLTSGSVVDEDEILLRFNEVVTEALAEAPGNYTLSLAGNAVATAALSGTTVRLTLTGPLALREDFTVTVAEIQDEAGNSSFDLSTTLRYDPTVTPRAGNLIITEFMADPSPQVGLPNAEYIELFNPTDTSVSLQNLGVASGGTPVTINGEIAVAPGEYVVLVDFDDAGDFTAAGIPVAPLDLPSLTNSGDVISLSYAGNIIQELTYTEAWYNDPERNDGGYSLEFTGGADAGCNANWRASLDPTGGTPGRANSVAGMPADDQPPMVVEVEIGNFGITLTFDEALDPGQITPALFSLDNGLAVAAVTFLSDRQIFLAADVVEGVIYTLTILPDFSDCGGNFPPSALQLQVAIPSDPVAGDVVINEVLFNPASGGSDFLELYNCSDKVFQIRDWVLTNNQSTTSSGQRTVGVSRLFLPGEYLTLTPDPDHILATFLEVNQFSLIDQSLPTLGDDEGNIAKRSENAPAGAGADRADDRCHGFSNGLELQGDIGKRSDNRDHGYDGRQGRVLAVAGGNEVGNRSDVLRLGYANDAYDQWPSHGKHDDRPKVDGYEVKPGGGREPDAAEEGPGRAIDGQ